MKQAQDIELFNLVLGYVAVILPALILLYYKTGLFKSLVIAVVRLTSQLALVALYLEFIFRLNNVWLNSAWVFVMIIVSAFTAINRSGLELKRFLLPVALSALAGLAITDAWFLGLVISLKNPFDAQYFIPVTGMILGNILNYNIIGLSAFYSSIQKDIDLYRFLLIHKEHRREALYPFMQKAFKTAMNPYIGSMSVIGLIALPGMMTGQILGGSAPATAIKYQIMILLSIFVACVLNLFLSLIFTSRYAFDAHDRPIFTIRKS